MSQSEEASVDVPKVVIRNFVGFVDINEKFELPIETLPFLAASKEIVSVIESFGKLFSPVVHDMSNNIHYIRTAYDTDPEKYDTLDAILIDEKNGEKIRGAINILWLKRALELFSQFFNNILEDKDEKNELKDALHDAYDKTLKAYHNWIVRNTFALIYRWIPSRQYLFGKDADYIENMQHLEEYQKRMEKCLKQVDKIIKQHGFDDPAKV